VGVAGRGVSGAGVAAPGVRGVAGGEASVRRMSVASAVVGVSRGNGGSVGAQAAITQTSTQSVAI